MPAVTPEEFLDLLKRSGLLEDDAYASALSGIKSESPGSFNDAALLAGEFVKRELLTSWHVRQLLKRKYKGFYLRQYKILGHLGSGGMSSVYLGEHIVMKRRVAIKVLPKHRLNPTYLDRFAREAQAIASLDSQHVVRAYDVDRYEDVHYIVMEYFEGQNLRQLVEKEGPLDYEDAADYLRQAALGLSDAHKSGIIHRDVKPDNIVVDDRGFVKILDLGLALLDEGAFDLRATMFDEDKILGTADYLAPEQALDSHNVDARADIYGLGATLYFCLVGIPPFPVGTISERLLAHQRKEPASIFNERPDAPSDLVEICMKMMAKKPDARYQSMEEVAEAMNRWLARHGFTYSLEAYENSEDLQELRGVNIGENLLSLNSSATELEFERSESFRISDDELNGLAKRRNEDSVDLYDASDSAGSISRSKSLQQSRLGAQSENIVLSQKTSLEHSLDPLELALSEIADTTKTRIPVPDEEKAAPRQVPERERSVQRDATGQSSAQIINIVQYQRNAERTNENPTPASAVTLNRVENVVSEARPNPPYDNSRNVDASNIQSNVPRQRVDAVNNELRERSNENGPNPFGDWYKEVPIWFWTVAIGGYAVAIFLAGILFTLLLNLN